LKAIFIKFTDEEFEEVKEVVDRLGLKSASALFRSLFLQPLKMGRVVEEIRKEITLEKKECQEREKV
jgi:hypothetical protein